MASVTGLTFSRRRFSDGITVSICDMCRAAVAVTLWQTELEKMERENTLNPETLDLWQMFIREIKRNRGTTEGECKSERYELY